MSTEIVGHPGELWMPATFPQPANARIVAALAKAQGEFGHIARDKTVSVQTKTGGSYKFSYAPLETIMAAVRKPLADNGLAMTQTIVKKDDGDYVRTLLLHSSGESLEPVDVPLLVKEPGPQAYGSGITYSRRYGITILLCIAADDDDDGNMAEGNKAEPRERKTTNKDSVSTTIGKPPDAPASAPPANGNGAIKDGFISEKQRSRFIAIYSNKGWKDDEVKALLGDFGISSRTLISKTHYEKLCGIVENQTYAEYLDTKTNPPA